MPDELDQLIEETLDDVEELPPTEEPDSTPDPSDATEGDAVFDDTPVEDEVADHVVEEPQDDSLPDTEPDGTGGDPDPGPSESELQLQRKLAERDQFIQSIIQNARTAAQKQAEAEEQKKRDDDYAKKLAEWDEMDPDEARREQVHYIAQQAQERQKSLQQRIAELEHEKVAAAEQQAQESARLQVIDLLASRFELTEFEVETMSDFPSPLLMEKYATRAKEQRQAQTKAAREAKRQSVASNPALKVGDNGGPAMPPARPAPKDLDELVDQLFE